MASDSYIRLPVRQVCNHHGVSVVAVTGYQNFARQVEKTRKQVQGSDLQLVVVALVRRYVKLGLERKVLEDIALAVFNVSPSPQRREPGRQGAA